MNDKPKPGAIISLPPQQALKAELERIRPALAAVLPRHVTADRLLKVVLSATARRPDILECSMPSIVRSVMQAAELGLELGGLLGEAYLVPFKGEATCIIGYRGLIKLARQTGEISTVSAHVVYRSDFFQVNLAEERIEHRPDLLAEERANEDLVAAYMTVRYKDGGKQIDVMTRSELDAIRGRSKAAQNGPWVSDFAEMCRKTVTRRGLKYAPISVQLATALEDEESDRVPSLLPDLNVVSMPHEARRLNPGESSNDP